MADPRSRSSIRRVVLTLLLATSMPAGGAAAEIVLAGGTGIGLGLLRAIGDRVTAREPGLTVEVLPSMGTAGGLRALAAGAIAIAYAARELESPERTAGLEEALCASTALMFVTPLPDPPSLPLSTIPGLYAAAAPAWPDGRPLKVILRARSGTEYGFLSARIPGLEAALAAAHQRPGMPIGVTDQENAVLAQRTANAFAIMTLLQLRAEALPLQPVPLDGIVASSETIVDGSFPLIQRQCVVVKPPLSPGVAAMLAVMRSAEGQALMRDLGAVPLP